MKGVYSHRWLQTFFETALPAPKEIHEGLVRHSFEIETVRTIGDDTVYETDILPSRSADCLAHYGIAKELSAIFSLPLTKKYFQEKFSFSDEKKEYIATDKCDRYTILVTDTIDTERIRDDKRYTAIQNFLAAIGQQSIHPIVDLTNYLLYDIGQPIHAFDADVVSGEFSVRQATDNEQVTLLGGEEIALKPEDIVITDKADDRVIALAGVKGGEKSGVTENTKRICLEIATFDAGSVRRTMRRTGYLSDAALRFSQGYPPELIDYTARRTAELFESFGIAVRTGYDHSRVSLQREWMTGVSVSEVNALLGTDYTKERTEDALRRLGFVFEYGDPRERFLAVAKQCIGAPYKWGASVSREAPDQFDCSSFVTYCASHAGVSLPRVSINQLFATDRIEPADIRAGDLVFTRSSDPNQKVHTECMFEVGCSVTPWKVEDGINHVAVALDENTIIEAEGGTGANQVHTAPLNREKIIHATRVREFAEERFIVSVPVERPDVRDTNDLIEEIGRILGYDTVPTAAPPSNTAPPSLNAPYAKRLRVLTTLTTLGFSEVMTYSFENKGAVCVAYPVAKDKGCLRTDLHSGMEEALKLNAYNGELLGLGEVLLVEIGNVFTGDGEYTLMALGVRSALGREKADCARIEREVKQHLEIPGGFDESGIWEVPFDQVKVPETDTAKTYAFVPPIGDKSYIPPSKYPFVLRDVAAFVPDGADAETMRSHIQQKGGDHLKTINLFDTFTKDGKTSFAFRLVFQSETRTLDDTAVNAVMDTIYAALSDTGYTIR